MTNKTVSQKNTSKTPFIFLSILLISELGFSSLCQNNVATSTTYFIPKMSDYCSGNTPCPRFRKQVRMQGSGTMPGGKLLTYTGKKINLGSCDTAFGASGNCLIPFISVAADPHYYQMGDIIKMPSLQGKVIHMPNGKTMIHPGFFIVQDTGGAIRGPNRFDFFTGSYNFNNNKNDFGIYATKETQMSDKGDCDDRKQFTVVRRSSSSYQDSLLAIEDSVRNSSDRQVASTSTDKSFAGVR